MVYEFNIRLTLKRVSEATAVFFFVEIYKHYTKATYRHKIY
jgi:hypothetical protein